MEWSAAATAQWLGLFGWMLGAGAIAGLLAGLLGVGGGIVLVPALFYGLGLLGVPDSVRMHTAIATSLATVIVTAYRSARSHHRRGAVDTELLRLWAPAIVVGVALGSGVSASLDGIGLARLFAVMALGIAAYMGFGSQDWRLVERPPTGPARFGFGGFVGGFSVMMGLGGGTLGVPTLTLCGVPIRRAVGTAAGLGPIIAVPGVLALIWTGWGVPDRLPGSLGFVHVLGFAMIVPMTWLLAPVGARWAHALPPKALRRGFAFFLGLTALRMLADSF